MTPEQFLALAAELPEAMLLVCGDGVILAANRSAGRCLGEPPDTVVGRSIQDFVDDGADKVQQSLRLWSRTRQLTASGLTIVRCGERTAYRSEGILLQPRSDSRPALILLRLIPRDHSSQQFVLLNHRLQELSDEIRRRRTAEDELRGQREWLHVTLTSIGDAVIATDGAGVVSLMNPVAEKLTGWSSEEAQGRPLKDIFHIVHEETREEVDNPVTRVLREGIVVGLANHTVLVSRDGIERPIDDSAAPIRGNDDLLQGVVLVFHDVSERRTLERALRQRAAELEEADQRKDEFIAMLAHELRNPLAPIRTAAEILRLSTNEPETVEQLAEVIERQSVHLAALVDDLLDVSRITRGKLSLRSERINLNRLVQAAVRQFDERIAKAGLEFQSLLPHEPLWVQGDPTRLTQVLDNLIENACKFTEPGDSVDIQLESDVTNNQAVLIVKDTGVGLDREMMNRLFVPFAQADRTLDRSRGGLGLGLALVKRIIDLHGGEISPSSDGVGRGATFVVRLPLRAEPSTAGAASADPGSLISRRILIIEDNSDAADTLVSLVRLMGHQVSLARTGADGLEMAIHEKPEVVLCDIGLPGIDGFEVATTLRKHPELRTTRLIALTGYGQDEDKQRVRQAGFDSHLTKPVEPNRLRDELNAGSDGQERPRS